LTYAPPAPSASSGAAAGRLAPSVTGSNAPASLPLTTTQSPYPSSQYCYAPDSGHTAWLTPPVVSAPNPSAPELGRLRRTAFALDGRPLFCLQPLDPNKRHLYVAAAANVSLEAYVEKVVYLYGPISYRGDLRNNCMTVVQVSP